MLAATSQFSRLRLRIRSNKTVSSLSVYESAYTYCPASSFLVSSRRNVAISRDFQEQLLEQMSQKFHYYVSNFAREGKVVRVSIPKWAKEREFRNNMLGFEETFQHLQIFHSDLLKMNYFWILKSAEVDFYETEASFTTPLLEMLRLKVKKVEAPLYTIRYARQWSEKEQVQISCLKKYSEWWEITELMPYEYNSL